jgi:hypothetical protein
MNEQPTFTAWRGVLFGLLISLPLWALLIWDWCNGMVIR